MDVQKHTPGWEYKLEYTLEEQMGSLLKFFLHFDSEILPKNLSGETIQKEIQDVKEFSQ